jgi:hypothetical protein
MDATRVPALARELALLDLDDGDGLLVPGERWSDRWDPREDCHDVVDLGWIGEDAAGVWLHRHPEAAMVEDDALWWPVTEWQLGHRELTAADRETLSHWQTEALIVMGSADAREQRRRMQARRGTDGQESESRD